MIDLEPRLDSKLRSEYERLEAENPPPWLVNFDPKIERPRRKGLSLLAGIVGVAVVAAGVATFGIELGSHLRPGPPATQAPLPAIPTVTTSGFPTSARIVIPVTRGAGTAVLPTVVSSGRLLYVAFDCDGGAVLKIQAKGDNTLAATESGASMVRCSNSTTTPRTYVAYSPGTGALLTLTIVAAKSTRWAIAAAEGDVSTSFPTLSPAVPENELSSIVLWDTYGTGVASLPTFTPAAPYWIQFACLGSGPISIHSSVGSALFTSEDCDSPGLIGLMVPPNQVNGRGVSLFVQAAPSTMWELLVVQDANSAIRRPFQMAPPKPSPGLGCCFKVPAGATVLIPLTHGEGSATLPNFTPTMPYYEIETSCSGPGWLTIVGPPGSTQSSVCDVPGSGGSGQGATPGVPISLKLTADQGTSWEILIFGVQQLEPQA
jgi:hypothetical protein